MTADTLRIETMAVADCVSRFEPRNARVHDLPTIKASIRESGFVSPPMLNEATGRFVFGHGRLQALYEMEQASESLPSRVTDKGGQWRVPVLRGLSFDSQRDALRYLVADNRTPEFASWELPDLGEILVELRDADKLVGTGYTNDDLDALLKQVEDSLRGVGEGEAEENSRLKSFTFQVSADDYDAVTTAIETYVAQHSVSKNDAFVALCLGR